MIPRAAVFLDRDGVINRNVLDPIRREYGAPRTAEDFAFAPGAIDGLRRLHQAGFPLFLVSNQPNYAKGKSSLEELEAIHGRLTSGLAVVGVSFTDSYYCYHHPQGVVAGYSSACDCRKPSPYFLFQARDTYGVRLKESWMVGDRATDVECGRAAGTRTIRVLEDHEAERSPAEQQADFEARDLEEAVGIILQFRSDSP